MDLWLAVLVVLGFGVLVMFVPCWLVRFWANRMVNHALHDIELGRQSPSPASQQTDSPMSLRPGSSGFTILDNQSSDRTLHIPWREIAKVVVFKRDLVTTDSISIAVELSSGAELEFPQDVEGWSDFAESLPKHLPGCKPFYEWLMKVASPAFQTNFTEIFVRSTAPSVASST